MRFETKRGEPELKSAPAILNMEIDKCKIKAGLTELGKIMYIQDAETVEIELSTPVGTLVFEITMNLKNEIK